MDCNNQGSMVSLEIIAGREDKLAKGDPIPPVRISPPNPSAPSGLTRNRLYAKRSWKVAFSVALAVALTASFTGYASVAEAGKLKASVYIVQTKIPNKLSEKGLLSFARSHNSKRLVETQQPKLDDRSWDANLVISFNQAPGDLEFQVLFYDIHDGPRRLVEDLSTFVNDRTQRTYLQKISLGRKRFKPNRNMELVVVVRHEEVARLKFGVLGQEVRRSGTVEFTDEEAK